MFNLPVGVGKELDDCDMICTHCDCKDDVDNGEYVNHAWYCEDCFKELFKKCPNCDVIISVDDYMCDDCLAEKKYNESTLKLQSNFGLLSKLCASEELFCISKDKTCKYRFEGGLLFMITETGTTLKTFFGINDIGTFDIKVVKDETTK